MSDSSLFRAVVVIPCRLHAVPLAKNLPGVLACGLPVIIVDDGESEEENAILRGLEGPMVTVLRHEGSAGKGAAVELGFKYARSQGFTHAVQIDADGQQDATAIPELLAMSEAAPDALICAAPSYENVPMGRFLARYITHFWVAIELGCCRVVDSMCGLRVYPLGAALAIMERRHVGKRMAFDTDILVRLYWSGVDLKFLPVKVTYPEDGVSNFAPFKDNVLISLMHTRLCLEKLFHFRAVHQRRYL